MGVRQGENLSPFLFSIFMNDLEDYLEQHSVNGIICETQDEENLVVTFFKLFLLLYADDTVIISETSDGLQKALNIFELYCKEFKLDVNINKTKIVIFSKGRKIKNLQFRFNNIPVEIVNEYKYLGIIMSRNGSYLKSLNHAAEQATRAMYGLFSKVRHLSLPVDIIIELYEKTIKPILLYGCEIWGSGKFDILERVQLKFFKSMFGLKKSTPTYIIYGEFGIYPLEIDIFTRMISFWTRLITSENYKLSSDMYWVLYTHDIHNNVRSKWIGIIKTILIECGLSGIWDQQRVENPKWLKETVKQKLKDLFVQKWLKWLGETSSGRSYGLYKDIFQFEQYLTKLDFAQAKQLLAFRTRNHRLPVETARCGKNKVVPNADKCKLCQDDIGDEYHTLLCCKKLQSQRKLFISPKYYKKPNVIKYKSLMETKNTVQLKKLCMFIKTISQVY